MARQFVDCCLHAGASSRRSASPAGLLRPPRPGTRGKTRQEHRPWEEAYAPGQFKASIFQVWSPLTMIDLSMLPTTNGNKVLISRGFYLDLFYPAHVHYLSDALPADPSADPAVLGGEAAMWTEIVDPTKLEARACPRTGAIAERLWSVQESSDLADFYRRLFRLSMLLNRDGVRNISDYTVQVDRLAGTLSTEPVKRSSIF